MSTAPSLDFEACYRAVGSRDPRFDGRFVTGVRTTGVYCRPVCPARTPLARNVELFPHPAAAEAAGYRSCRRCRPESMPGSRHWDARADLVARALRLIADGAVESTAGEAEGGVAGLAKRLHVSERHLHRSFVAELGVGPLAVARTRRAQLALQLLDQTALPVTEVAYAAGFASLRQFNATMQELYGRTPTQLRDGRRPLGAGLTLRLSLREPYDGAAILDYLAGRAIPGVEEVTGGSYRRVVATRGGPAVLELRPVGGAAVLTLTGGDARQLAAVVARSRRLLDLDADPAAVAAALGDDPALAGLVTRRPGLRVPGAYDGFELAVRALLGQQVTVRGASTLAGRLVAAVGTPLPQPVGTLAYAFPTADAVAAADLSGLGVPQRRLDALRALAAAVADGQVRLDGADDPAETRQRLLALPGVGPWTVDYLALRALRDPDAFPAGDLGLQRAAALLGLPATPAGLARYSERWRPWRAYAALHLWTSLSPDKRQERAS